MKSLRSAAVALACLVSSAAAIGANTSFMQDSVLAELRDDDVTLLMTTIDEALALPEGESRSWANAKTGAQGTITRRAEYSKDGRECRKLRVETQARGRSGGSEWDYCRGAGGRWELLPP